MISKMEDNNGIKRFDNIKQCMKFIMNYNGELRIIRNEIYENNNLIAYYYNGKS